MNRAAFVCVLLTAGLLATPARADEACSNAYDAALALSDAPERDPLALYRAGAHCLESCAKNAADQSTLTECESWKTKARDLLAFATFDIRDGAGAQITDGEVSVDGGAPRPLTRAPLELNPGPHTFRIDVKLASGTVSSTASESFNSRESKTVKVSLKPDGSLGAGTPSGPPQPDQGGGLPTWAFVVGGVGAGAMIAGSVLLGLGASAGADESNTPACDVFSGSFDPIACNQADEDAKSTGTVELGVGAVLLVAGAGGVVAGIVGLATAPKGKPKAPAITFVPVVGPGLAVGLLRGTF
ncbi:MAG: hypothetical protein U0414_08795 [Polyangiaceae bacterium]